MKNLVLDKTSRLRGWLQSRKSLTTYLIIIESCQVGRLQLPFTLVYYGNYCTRGVALMLIQQCIRVCSKLGTPVGLPFSYPHSIPRQAVESRVQSVLWKEDGRVTLVEKNITH